MFKLFILGITSCFQLGLAQDNKEKDGDYVLTLALEGGFTQISPNPISLGSNQLEFNNTFGYSVGLDFYKRLGYTTKISIGASYNNFVKTTPAEGDYDISPNWQIPLRFHKVFQIKNKYSIVDGDRKTLRTFGIGVVLGAYYTLNANPFVYNGLLDRPEDLEIGNNVFGASFGLGIVGQNQSIIFEVRQDLGNIVSEDSFFGNNLERISIVGRWSFDILDF